MRDWSNNKVLIAEDEESNFLFLEAALSETNINVIHAKNGQEALELINKHTDIDLVLMDLKMPLLSGYEAAREIRTDFPDIPVIAQTAYAMETEKSDLLENGCDDIITKPIQINELFNVMNKWLKSKPGHTTPE